MTAPRQRSQRACRALALAGALWLSMATAAAVQPAEMLPDPALEARARGLSAGLRCMVCQNQSIDDSDAPLARDLRLLVRQRLVAGDSDEAVLDYLVSRYGQFVLLRPRLEWETVLLWGTPVALLSVGAAYAVVSGRGRRRQRETVALTEAEEARIAELLDRRA